MDLTFSNRVRSFLWAALVGMIAMPAWSQTWSWPGCTDVTNADFKYDTLVRRGIAPDANLAEPDKIAFDKDANGNVDLYFVEIRPGNIKKYSAATKTVRTLVQLPNWGRGTGNNDYLTTKNSSQTEEGVTGIALDPNFKTNHYVYIHWSPLPATNEVFRVSRFTVTTGTNGDTILTTSEKILLDMPAQRQECCHTGGAMEFDAYGDLWITMGANTGTKTQSTYNGNPPENINETLKFRSDEWGSPNTHGFRGGILRIHPDESVKGYSIPHGNFGEYFYTQSGKSKYLDTSKVLPEIYIKGTRNAYTIALDPVRRWVAWGDVGPDGSTPLTAANGREEENLRTTPGYEGWPYFVGHNTAFSIGTGVTKEDSSAPVNKSVWNTGLDTLPPARGAFHYHTIGTSPITGPIYRYDGALSSTVKFPPYFSRKWFVTDHDLNTVNVLTLDSLGTTVTNAQAIFTNHTFHGPIDFKAGPDGALYMVEYGNTNFASGTGTMIERVSYTGSCRPATPLLEQANVTSIFSPFARYASHTSGWWVNLRSGASVLVPEGMSSFQLFDLTGRKVWEIQHLQSGQTFQLPALRQGAFQYRWISSASK